MKYACVSCGAPYSVLPDIPRCSRCSRWNTIKIAVSGRPRRILRAVGDDRDLDDEDEDGDEEDEDSDDAPSISTREDGSYGPISLARVEDIEAAHVPTKVAMLDELFSGGFVKGAVIVLGGDPGAGKTTITIQIVEWLDALCYYASAEMQEKRLKLVVKRVKTSTRRIKAWRTIDIDEATSVDPEALRTGKKPPKGPVVAVFDSLQAFRSNDVRGGPGTTTQIADVMMKIVEWTQAHDAITFVISRLNAVGKIAGPNGTQHDGDVTAELMLSPLGESSPDRIFRVRKNRDGQAPKVATCRMDPKTGILVFPKPERK